MPHDPTQLGLAQGAVSALGRLGVTPPQPVLDAVAVLEAISDYQADAADPEALHTAKPGDVGKLLDVAIDAAARKSAFTQLRGDFYSVGARRLIGAVDSHTDVILAAVAPVWVKAADPFMDAIRRLPAGWTDPARLIAAGPDAVATLQVAQEHQPVLEACADLRRYLPAATIAGVVGKATSFAKLRSDDFAGDVAAVRAGGPLGELGSIVTVDGVEGLHWWSSVAEHRSYVTGLPHVDRPTMVMGLI